MYPILLEFGPVTVFSLWFMITLGFVAGSLIFVKLAKRYRMRLTVLFDHGIPLFFWTLIVSRLVFVVFHSDLYFYQFKFSKLTSIFAVWDKGLSFWGAALAWAAGVWFLSQKQKEPASKVFDIAAPAFLIGIFFGNIGAFLDGINFGAPTQLPWGMTFLSANVKYIAPIHPTQIYGALYVAAIAAFLFILLKELRGRLPGFVAETGVFLFSLLRFFEEFFRGDETVKIAFLRLPHLVSAVFVLAGCYLIYRRFMNKDGGDPEGLLKNFVINRIFRKRATPIPEKFSPETAISFQNEAV